MEMRGSDETATITPSIFPRAVYVRKVMERMSSFYYKRNRVEPVNEIRTVRRPVLARLTLERTMGHGESQIGYLANYIIMYDGYAYQPALRGDRRAAMCKSCVVYAGYVDRRIRKPTKFCGHTHRGFNAV